MDNTPAPQKVFWKTSQRDPENIDIDEIKALPDREPLVDSDEEEKKKSSMKPSGSKTRLRSGSASRRIVIGSKPPLRSPMKVEANRK